MSVPFLLNGPVMHNCRYLSNENLHTFKDDMQYSNIHAWVDILGDSNIGT